MKANRVGSAQVLTALGEGLLAAALLLHGFASVGYADAPQTIYPPEEKVIYFSDGYHGGRIFPGATDASAALGEILTLLDRYPVYRATLELESALWEELLADPQQAALLAHLRERVSEGRVELVGGTYSQPFMYPNDGESIIRQFTIGLGIVERGFGSRPITYAAQEPGFTTQLPQILNGFGFRFAKLMNRWMAFGSPPADDEAFFRWRGPDGSVVLTSPRYGCQGPIEYWATPVFGSKSIDLFPDRTLLDTCERSGVTAPFIVTLEDLLSGNLIPWSGLGLMRQPPIFVRWVTPHAYLDDMQESQPGREPVSLPERTIPADRIVDNPWDGAPKDALPFPWGATGGDVQRAARATERAVLEAERWAALAAMATEAFYPETELDALWRDALWAENHDLWVVRPPVFVGDVEQRVLAGTEPIVEQALATLAAAVDTLSSVPSSQRQPIVVFNSASHDVRGVAATAVPPSLSAAPALSVTNEHGDAAPYQLGTDGSLLLAAEVPALGYRTYSVGAQLPAAPTGSTGASATIVGQVVHLENESYAADFDLERGGALIHLFDKARGSDLVPAGQPAHVLTGYFPATGTRANSAVGGTAGAEIVESGPERAVVRFEHTGFPVPLRSWATLTAGVKRLDLQLEADFGTGVRVGSDAYGPESWRSNGDKLAVHLPLSAAQEVLRDAPFQIEATQRQSFWADHFAATAGPDGYVAVLLDRPSALVRTGNDAALVLAYGGDYIYPPAPLAGTKRFAYALTSDTDVWDASTGAWARVDEWEHPLRAVATARHTGTLPESASLVNVSGGATVSAIFFDDGQQRVRLFNPSPSPRDVTLQLLPGVALPKLLDLRGQEIGDAAMPVQLSPFGLATLGAGGGAAPPPEMPAVPPAQSRYLIGRRAPVRARLYLKPDFSLGSREPPIPRPWTDQLQRGGERAFIGSPLSAACTLAGNVKASVFVATRSASATSGTARIHVRIEALDGNQLLAEGDGIANLARCEARFETTLTPLCAIAATFAFPVVPGAHVAAGERVVARISLAGTTGTLPRLFLLYDSTHYSSRLELPVEDLLSVAAARIDPLSGRVEVDVEDRLGSDDVLDATVVLSPQAGSTATQMLPLAFERDVTATRSTWLTDQTVGPAAALLAATVVVRNQARSIVRTRLSVEAASEHMP